VIRHAQPQHRNAQQIQNTAISRYSNRVQNSSAASRTVPDARAPGTSGHLQLFSETACAAGRSKTKKILHTCTHLCFKSGIRNFTRAENLDFPAFQLEI